MRRQYDQDTYLEIQMPWSTYTGGAALCSDGVVRRLKRIATTADTFFSIPATVYVAGHSVTGYVTVTESFESTNRVVTFHSYTYGKNGHLLP